MNGPIMRKSQEVNSTPICSLKKPTPNNLVEMPDEALALVFQPCFVLESNPVPTYHKVSE